MQKEFINREKELSFLNKKYKEKSPDLFILYGRRRIGKTQLSLEFLKNKNGIYFLCSEEGDLININEMQKKMSDFVGIEFKNIIFKNWYDLFAIFFKMYNKKEKLIIIIDEFPYLIKKNKAIPSIFQKLWDTLLYNQNIFIILTGSSVSIMEKEVLNVKSPLYGRRTAQWDLQPIPFKHIINFFPKLQIIDLFKTYFVLGGVPAYLQKINANLNFKENIIEGIFTKGNFLNMEGNILMNYEFSETNNYKLILNAISKGKQKQKDIVGHTYLDYSLVSKYLTVLKSLSIIHEEIPITESKRFKGRLYKINDNFLQFWFRYLYSNISFIESHNPKDIYSYYEEDINKFFGCKFEDLIKELFINYDIATMYKYNSFGRMWGKLPKKYLVDKTKSTYEIDVVGINNMTKKNILFCEVKWKDNVNATKIAQELIAKSKFVKWGEKQRIEEFIVVAKSFFEKVKVVDGIPITCLDLNDLKKLFS